MRPRTRWGKRERKLTRILHQSATWRWYEPRHPKPAERRYDDQGQ